MMCSQPIGPHLILYCVSTTRDCVLSTYAINPSKISLAGALYPNAGTLLFGNDINKLAADSADISRNLQKNLASRQAFNTKLFNWCL